MDALLELTYLPRSKWGDQARIAFSESIRGRYPRVPDLVIPPRRSCFDRLNVGDNIVLAGGGVCSLAGFCFSAVIFLHGGRLS